MARTVWIDVTDFLNWKGAFTGFQHIQYNMAKHYLASEHDVKFFVYRQQERRFEAVDFDPDVAAKDGVRFDGADETPTAQPSIVLRAAKKYLPPQAKRLTKRIIVTLKQSRSTQNADNTTTRPTLMPFAKDDVVVVLGGIWHGTFAEDMALCKKKRGFKFVHIVHDMIPVVCPQCVVEDLPKVFADYKDQIFRISDGLIINSNSSKKDAIQFMNQRGISVPKSVVFRLADEPITTPPEPMDIKGDFILSLGTVEGRKNHAVLYYAYKEAARRGIELPTLVITGRIGWLIDDIRYIISRDPQVKDKIIFTDQVTNAQRAWLLENCLYSVWPSFYEGWGMPIAESLAYGKPCIVSETSSMPEVGGGLCEYLSPYDSLAWMQKLDQYAHDDKLRTSLQQRIKADFKTTSWEQMYNVIAKFVDGV